MTGLFDEILQWMDVALYFNDRYIAIDLQFINQISLCCLGWYYFRFTLRYYHKTCYYINYRLLYILKYLNHIPSKNVLLRRLRFAQARWAIAINIKQTEESIKNLSLESIRRIDSTKYMLQVIKPNVSDTRCKSCVTVLLLLGCYSTTVKLKTNETTATTTPTVVYYAVVN